MDMTAEQQVEQWNDRYPPYTVVRYWPEGYGTGRGVLGITAGPAHINATSGAAVIKLVERGTVIALDRVRPVPMDWCQRCGAPFQAANRAQLDARLFWHHWDHHRDQGRAEVQVANAEARRAGFELLHRQLGRGWKVFRDRPAAIDEPRITYWYAVPCPAGTPAEVAVTLPGLLKHTDPRELALLGRTVNARRAAA